MKNIIACIILITSYNSAFSQKIKINYETYSGFDDQMIKVKLDSAIIILEQIVNDSSFENSIKKTKYTRKKGMSNEDIYNLIKTGQEEETVPDNVINLKLMVYNNEKNEVGHTDGGDTIHTHKGYILKNLASLYAAHLLHEYCHVLGFRHAYLRMPFRYMTVPYRVGTIVAEF